MEEKLNNSWTWSLYDDDTFQKGEEEKCLVEEMDLRIRASKQQQSALFKK